jgi:hypothetical protein
MVGLAFRPDRRLWGGFDNQRAAVRQGQGRRHGQHDQRWRSQSGGKGTTVNTVKDGSDNTQRG